MDKDEIKKLISEEVKKQLSYSDRKLGDTPTDNLMLTPRKYVNMYGLPSARPSTFQAAQQYFDTVAGYPIFRNPNSSVWTSATGSVV